MANRSQVNSPEAIARAWDGLSDNYAADLAQMSKRKALAAIELAAIRRELGSRKSLHILDAGCGPGWHGIELARAGHSLVMADLSPKMIEKARCASEASDVQDRIVLLNNDIRDLPLESASFDAVIACGTVVSDCGNADAALGEFSRLLKQGGLAMFSLRNLWASFDGPTRSVCFNAAKRWIESGKRLIRQGHQDFDWVLFTVKGLQAACKSWTMDLQRTYPVGVVAPPKEDKDVPSYVQFHIDMANESGALVKAHELFAVATKCLVASTAKNC